MIVIISPTRIEVDGRDAGLPLDYFLAHPESRTEIKQAFVDWHASHVLADQARDADVSATKAALQADADTKIAAMQADVDALGTKEEARAIRKQQAIDALQADIVAKQAELAALVPSQQAEALAEIP